MDLKDVSNKLFLDFPHTSQTPPCFEHVFNLFLTPSAPHGSLLAKHVYHALGQCRRVENDQRTLRHLDDTAQTSIGLIISVWVFDSLKTIIIQSPWTKPIRRDVTEVLK